MDVSSMLNPDQLPFPVPKSLARDILELKAAWVRDDSYTTDYIDEVHGSARMVGEREDAWIRSYYCDNGWMENPHGSAY